MRKNRKNLRIFNCVEFMEIIFPSMTNKTLRAGNLLFFYVILFTILTLINAQVKNPDCDLNEFSVKIKKIP